MLLSDDVTSETIYSQDELFYDFEVHYAGCNKPYTFIEISSTKTRVLELDSDYHFNDVVTITSLE
jgi:hypothetical protein